MAASKKTTKKTAAKKQPTAAQKREAKLEARVAELEGKLAASTDREDRMASIIERFDPPATTPTDQPNEGENVTEGRTIRNLRGVPVHLRLKGQGGKEPYRIVLEPRGKNGDIATVPGNLVETTDFVNSYHAHLFEIITESEARDTHYGPQGFQPVQRAQMVRMEENTITTQQIQPDGKNVGRPIHENIGMNVVSMPGSDPQLTAQFQHDRQVADPDAAKLQQKGIMQPLPSVVTVEAGQGGSVQQW